MPTTTPCRNKGSKRPTARSRELRNNATDAEKLLWTRLSARQVAGVRFNRQFPIGPFICDFVSRGAKLMVVVDGGQHRLNIEAEARRTAYLRRHGYRVIRFWNNDVLGNIDGVVAEIERVLNDSPSPSPSLKGGGNDSALLPSRPQGESNPPLPSRLRKGSGEGLS